MFLSVRSSKLYPRIRWWVSEASTVLPSLWHHRHCTLTPSHESSKLPSRSWQHRQQTSHLLVLWVVTCFHIYWCGPRLCTKCKNDTSFHSSVHKVHIRCQSRASYFNATWPEKKTSGMSCYMTHDCKNETLNNGDTRKLEWIEVHPNLYNKWTAPVFLEGGLSAAVLVPTWVRLLCSHWSEHL